MQKKLKINYASACAVQYDRFIGLFIIPSNDRLLIVFLSCTHTDDVWTCPVYTRKTSNDLSNNDCCMKTLENFYMEQPIYDHLSSLLKQFTSVSATNITVSIW